MSLCVEKGVLKEPLTHALSLFAEETAAFSRTRTTFGAKPMFHGQRI